MIGELNFVSMLPKTRSGKIMRRVLKAVTLDRDPGDITTTEDEGSVDEARQATKGSYLWADLVGLRAETPAGEPIGTVREILRAGETDVLVLDREQGGELLVPAIASVVRDVDIAGGRVVVSPQEELR